MSPVRKTNPVFLSLVKLRVNSVPRLPEIAGDAIVGDLAFQLGPGKSKILRANVLSAAMRGKNP